MLGGNCAVCLRKKKKYEQLTVPVCLNVTRFPPSRVSADEETFHSQDVDLRQLKRSTPGHPKSCIACGVPVFGICEEKEGGEEKMLQTGNYSLVLLIQLSLLAYDLFVNSFSELLRGEPVIQLVLFIIQDIAILFNVIIVLLMMFNTYVFQVGLVSLLLERFRALLIFSALYLTLSICFHCWVLNLRWLDSNRFVWTDGLQSLFVFQRTAAVLYYYLYKRTAEYMGDPRLYEDSLWLRDAFARARQ
ncbi:unnamed protein product [Pleuronectes platessa]|uniref:Transmembrane protein 138 n=2 Tax=Pleuronectes platessa TaxID=8262 RepID=A0A9N7U8K8_PLEPL|nr:unnamed protein product [Pleuronectes platessa]